MYQDCRQQPVSIYSKDFTVDSRTDTSASSSSAAPYLRRGAIGGRAAWARHRHDPSIDSVVTDLYWAGPAWAKKCLMRHYMSPSCVSSSPSDYDQSSQVVSSEFSRNSVCDSIMDIDEARSPGHHIYDKTNQQMFDLAPSVFGDTSAHGFLPPFRPLSVLSTLSIQSPPKEDDTWISVSPIEFAAKYSLLTFSSDDRWWENTPKFRSIRSSGFSLCTSGEAKEESFQPDGLSRGRTHFT